MLFAHDSILTSSRRSRRSRPTALRPGRIAGRRRRLSGRPWHGGGALLVSDRPGLSNCRCASYALLASAVCQAVPSAGAFVVVMPGVGAPFPEVTVHVVQLPGVGPLGADGRIVAGRIAGVPAVVDRVPPDRRRTNSLSACQPGLRIPIRPRWGADQLPRRDQFAVTHRCGRAATEFLCVVVASISTVLRGPFQRLGFSPITVCHKILRHLVTRDRERAGDPHAMRRAFGSRATVRAPIEKSAGKPPSPGVIATNSSRKVFDRSSFAPGPDQRRQLRRARERA